MYAVHHLRGGFQSHTHLAVGSLSCPTSVLISLRYSVCLDTPVITPPRAKEWGFSRQKGSTYPLMSSYNLSKPIQLKKKQLTEIKDFVYKPQCCRKCLHGTDVDKLAIYYFLPSVYTQAKMKMCIKTGPAVMEFDRGRHLVIKKRDLASVCRSTATREWFDANSHMCMYHRMWIETKWILLLWW